MSKQNSKIKANRFTVGLHFSSKPALWRIDAKQFCCIASVLRPESVVLPCRKDCLAKWSPRYQLKFILRTTVTVKKHNIFELEENLQTQNVKIGARVFQLYWGVMCEYNENCNCTKSAWGENIYPMDDRYPWTRTDFHSSVIGSIYFLLGKCIKLYKLVTVIIIVNNNVK